MKKFRKPNPTELGAFRLPGPQSGKTPRYLGGQKLVVDLYQRTLACLTHSSSGGGWRPSGSLSGEAARNVTNRVWSYTRDAKVFSIPLDLYEAFLHTGFSLAAHCAGLEQGSGEKFTPEVNRAIYESVIKIGRGSRLPSHLPFLTMYLGLDVPMQMEEGELNSHGMKDAIYEAWLYGFVIHRSVHSDNVYALHTVQEDPSEAFVAVTSLHGIDLKVKTFTGWDVEGNFYFYTIPKLVEWINSHQTLISEDTKSFAYRTFHKKTGKIYSLPKQIPPPFYTVYIRDSTIEEIKKESKQPQLRLKPQHRYDVRGCDMIKVARGKLPIDKKIYRALKRDKRRQFYFEGQPPGEILAAMAKRGKPPRRMDEWLAVLPYRRKPHQKGPEDGPYIPAIRKSARKAG